MTPTGFKEFLTKLQGDKAYLVCARYAYRGIVSEVGWDSLTLANAMAVQETGSPLNKKPVREDPVGLAIITFDSIESVTQPPFCMAPLPHEPGYGKT